MEIINYLPTWRCEFCDYPQHFEPKKENMDEHFNFDQTFKLSDVGHFECPSCALRGIRGNSMIEVNDQEKMSKNTIIVEE